MMSAEIDFLRLLNCRQPSDHQIDLQQLLVNKHRGAILVPCLWKRRTFTGMKGLQEENQVHQPITSINEAFLKNFFSPECLAYHYSFSKTTR
jgi:hypothetical protein